VRRSRRETHTGEPLGSPVRLPLLTSLSPATRAASAVPVRASVSSSASSLAPMTWIEAHSAARSARSGECGFRPRSPAWLRLARRDRWAGQVEHLYRPVHRHRRHGPPARIGGHPQTIMPATRTSAQFRPLIISHDRSHPSAPTVNTPAPSAPVAAALSDERERTPTASSEGAEATADAHRRNQTEVEWADQVRHG
jgi:hypothetical protein